MLFQRMKTKVAAFGSIFVAGMASLGAPSALAAEFDMKIGIIARNDPLHHYIARFEELLEERSGGRIDVTLFPGAQLGGESTLVEGVQIGTIEMIAVPGVYLKGLDERFQVADAPGLFRDIDHAASSLQDPKFRDAYLALAESKGIAGVSVWIYDTTSFATTKPVEHLKDLADRKIRVLASDVETDLIEELGAVPVSMPFVEVVPSLQQNTIDGVRTSPIIMSAFKTETAANYLTVTNDGTIAIAGLVSNAFMNRLPEDLKEIVRAVGADVEKEMLAFVKERQAAVQQKWRDAGGSVGELSAGDQAALLAVNAAASEKTLGAGSTAEFYLLLKDVAAGH